MTPPEIFARRVFNIAGWLGILLLVPSYFLEERTGIDHPPAVTHPEYYYGFVGVALAWQVAFLIMARDPQRFRPIMIPSILEKLSFGLALPILYALGRVGPHLLAASAFDLTLAGLFTAAYCRLPSK